MPLSETLIDNALLGTQHAAPDAPSEVNLLLDALVSDWREKCGYIPGYDHRPLPTPAPDPALPLLSERAMQDFHLMRNGGFARALPEWLIGVAEARRRLGDEYLPHLLALGQKKPNLRPALWLVVGEAGVWLANQVNNQNWKWVQEEQVMDWTPDAVRAIGREREAALSERWKAANPNEITTSGLSELKDYTHLWTESFTHIFLEAVGKMSLGTRGWETQSSLQLAVELSCSFPQRLVTPIMKCFSSQPIEKTRGSNTELLRILRAVFDFRAAMLQTLSEQE